MSQPLWQKQQTLIDQDIMHYMAGEDIQLDGEILLYDILASQAHVRGLNSIQVLTDSESEKLLMALDKLAADYQSGDFTLDGRFEDGHSAIEFYLVEKLEELGKKIHTGRSRNDQVLVATRLYLKDALQKAIDLCQQASTLCLTQAKNTKDLPMPGYTHMQRAVPSTCGMWFAGFAEAMIDNLSSLKDCLKLIDANPLGTAAGYGVNLPLNRELTSLELGFSRLQINPVYTQNSRGKYEIAALNALSMCLLDIRRFAWDLSLFSTQEFDFISLPEQMTTGSSIMPNKRNPDLIELMRAAFPVVQSAIVELQSLLSLPSGYQRDLQLTKPPLIRGIQKGLQTLTLFPRVIEAVQFKPAQLTKAIDGPMYATDQAVELAVQGVPFRTAYQTIANQSHLQNASSPADSIAKRVSPGACNNLMLAELEQRLEALCIST